MKTIQFNSNSSRKEEKTMDVFFKETLTIEELFAVRGGEEDDDDKSKKQTEDVPDDGHNGSNDHSQEDPLL